MTEKRFELEVNNNGQFDIVDWYESKEKNAICIYNDLDVIPFSSASSLCDLLNQLNDGNEQLKEQNQRLSEQKHIDFVKDCTAIEEELSNLKCANKKLLESNDFLLKEHEKLTSVNQELRNELKFDEEMYKTFKEIIDEADDLITSHLSKHYQRQWKNFCKHRGVLDD